MNFNISRRAVFDVWLKNEKNERYNAVLKFILQLIGNDVHLNQIKILVKSVCQRFDEKWVKCQRHEERFLSKYSEWLVENIDFSRYVIEVTPSTSIVGESSTSGRPIKQFSDCCSKTKRRKVKQLVDEMSQEELLLAAEMKLRKSGKKDSANIVKELSHTSPTRGTAIKRAMMHSETPKSLSPDQALAMMIDTNLSTHQYRLVREYAKAVNSKLYPSYDAVQQSKRLCYPLKITVTETSAEINVQSLIDHTVQRLCAVHEDVILSLQDICDVNIIIKWGCDGADQSQYKQKFSEENVSDESLFNISMVPIQMYCISNNKKIIIWQNPAPSSTKYCRPIRFYFVKETPEVILKEVEHIKKQISVLIPTIIKNSKMHLKIKPILVLCMIDGKVCSALSMYSSSQTCYLCGATPKNMNDSSAITKKKVDENMLPLGLSPLHARIRFMECLLHIAYRLEIKKWQAKGAEMKAKVAERKLHIQNRFKIEMGLLVDMPKQKSGNTNDGNTARRFFRNAEKSSEITGIDLTLIKRFHVILETLACGFTINPSAFEQYAVDTRELYLEKYSWYYMPVTVHKVLYHGKDIIASSILPIGQLSEEAQEARNKDTRHYREAFTRKTSRVETNRDLLNRLLISSDPFICSLRKSPKTKRGVLSTDVLSLLSGEESIEQRSDSE